jgi:P-type Na+/K+ transporter
MGKPKRGQEGLDSHVPGQSNKPISKPTHSLSFDEVLKELGASGLDGLSENDAKQRLEEFGNNELDNGPGVNPAKILVKQIANAMMLVRIATNNRWRLH